MHIHAYPCLESTPNQGILKQNDQLLAQKLCNPDCKPIRTRVSALTACCPHHNPPSFACREVSTHKVSTREVSTHFVCRYSNTANDPCLGRLWHLIQHITPIIPSSRKNNRSLRKPQCLQGILAILSIIDPSDLVRDVLVRIRRTNVVLRDEVASYHVKESDHVRLIVVLCSSNEAGISVDSHVRFAVVLVLMACHPGNWESVWLLNFHRHADSQWWPIRDSRHAVGLVVLPLHVADVVNRHAVLQTRNDNLFVAHILDLTDTGDMHALDGLTPSIGPDIEDPQQTRTLADDIQKWIVFQHLDCEDLIMRCTKAALGESVEYVATIILIDTNDFVEVAAEQEG